MRSRWACRRVTGAPAQRADFFLAGGHYSRAEIPEYWVVNIPDQCIVVHLEPAAGRYRRITTYGRGDAIRLQAFPDVEVTIDSILG